MLRVMLADDEQYERDYLEKTIKEYYPTLLKVVYKAKDGVEFMEKLDEYKPHMILLDIKMPRMDGFETAKLIRDKYPDIHVVIVSAYSDFNYAKQAMKLGITEYLLKPYADSELCATLDRVVARLREREDTLAMLSNLEEEQETSHFDFFKDLEKDILWNIFLKRKRAEDQRKLFELWGVGDGWMKVVLISSSALSSMGDFSQEVLKNYFHMDGVVVMNSIWMSQMAIGLFAKEKDSFIELNSCIHRARNYLVEEHQIPVACGVSGAYHGLEHLVEAYDEAASFITDFSDPEMELQFKDIKERMEKICELEEKMIGSYIEEKKEETIDSLNELVEILEQGLDYQDMAIKLNFGRSLFTIMQGINRIPGVRIKTTEALSQMERLEQLNFSGDHLKYHLDFFADMKVLKE